MCTFVVLGDIRLKGDIVLSIKRAKISTNICAHPACNMRIGLHVVPFDVRRSLLKIRRFYMPKHVKACAHHLHFEAWTPGDCEVGENIFTVKHVEDMVDMLRSEQKKVEGNVLTGNKNIEFQIENI